MSNSYSRCGSPKRGLLLERLQELSVTMLRAATTAMAVRNPVAELSLANLAGGCLAFSGTDVPLSRAVGVGTLGSVGEDDVMTVESFYKSRNSEVRVVISERTDPSLQTILENRGYESGGYLQNWWLPLEYRVSLPASQEVEIVGANLDDADLWVRTVAAGFEEENLPIDDATIPSSALDTFFCLG